MVFSDAAPKTVARLLLPAVSRETIDIFRRDSRIERVLCAEKAILSRFLRLQPSLGVIFQIFLGVSGIFAGDSLKSGVFAGFLRKNECQFFCKIQRGFVGFFNSKFELLTN